MRAPEVKVTRHPKGQLASQHRHAHINIYTWVCVCVCACVSLQFFFSFFNLSIFCPVKQTKRRQFHKDAKATVHGLQTTYLYWDIYKRGQIHLQYLQDGRTCFSQKLYKQAKQILSARNKTVKSKNHITSSAKINKLHTWISLNSSWKSRRVLSPRSSVDRNLVLFNWMPMMLFSMIRLCSRCTKFTSSFGRLKLTYQ